MEPTPRENLRRAVRRAVHRACWRRLDGDETATPADAINDEFVAALVPADPPAASDEEIRQWIQDDEADFDRALLISDLVARRTAQAVAATPTPAVIVTPTPVAASTRAGRATAAETRAPGRTTPAIADMLDDMLAQDRKRAARNPAA